MNEESKCPVCGGEIVMDSGEKGCSEPKSFHCESCGVKFAFPTPQGISDMMKRHRKMNAANTSLLGAMLGR